MFELTERDTQTKIKHEILEEYLLKWGSIITIGLKGNLMRYPNMRSKFNARFVYVDYFSHTGAYLEDGQTVFGSPILGVKALDGLKQFFIKQTSGVSPQIVAILFEEDKQAFDGLLETLKNRGYADRIKQTDDFSRLRDGDIAVIRGDSSKYIDQILKFLDILPQTYSFHFIDPYGVKGVERNNIERIVSRKGVDCIINMMLNPISRFISAAIKEDPNSTEQAYARSFDKFFGSDVWRKIATDFEIGTIKRDEANRQLVSEFATILREADKTLTVKQIPLQFQDRDQTIYHLFLTTHDPTGAFRMNEILADARIREYDYRIEKRHMKTKPGQLSFLDSIPDQKRPTEPEPDIDLLADQVYSKCTGRTLQFREVLGEMSYIGFFIEDVKDSLGKLKEQKRAFFDGALSKMTNGTVIRFA